MTPALLEKITKKTIKQKESKKSKRAPSEDVYDTPPASETSETVKAPPVKPKAPRKPRQKKDPLQPQTEGAAVTKKRKPKDEPVVNSRVPANKPRKPKVAKTSPPLPEGGSAEIEQKPVKPRAKKMKRESYKEDGETTPAWVTKFVESIRQSEAALLKAEGEAIPSKKEIREQAEEEAESTWREKKDKILERLDKNTNSLYMAMFPDRF